MAVPPPAYAFCEIENPPRSYFEDGRTPWHIRVAGAAQTLCGRTADSNIDGVVPVSKLSLFYADCVGCIEIFRADEGMSGLDPQMVRTAFQVDDPEEPDEGVKSFDGEAANDI